MIKYVSTKGGGHPVDFEKAILDGFAEDGGLYVPETLPTITMEQLNTWKNLSYTELSFEILSLFIDRSIISSKELKEILSIAYADFEKEEIIPIHPLKSRREEYVMELFHGPTISFKDVGMAFMVTLVNFLLERKNDYLTLVVATTGDTGPAAAYFSAGKSNLDAWVLYPKGMITEEQERQMTTLPHSNIHAVGVANCPEGGDDLDAVIKKLYANKDFKEKLKLSSVNSINWGRIMMQTVHYFYGYLQVVETVGEQVNFAVPSGGFGNLGAGSLAKLMGLPVHTFILGNNKNACLHRIFQKGIFSKADIVETVSNAIDILIPINFWRYLYFSCGRDPLKMKSWIDEFDKKGIVQFDEQTFDDYRKGYQSASISDDETLNIIKSIYAVEKYILDPHAAVALAAMNQIKGNLGNHKTIHLATAHPAKFPAIIQRALGVEQLPTAATHHSIATARQRFQKTYTCDCTDLENALLEGMESHWILSKTSKA